MPSTSGRQHRYMEMIAHDPAAAKREGVPQKVGQDFVAADKAAGKHFPVRTKASRYGNPRKRPGKASLTGQQVAGTGTGIEAT